MKINQFIKRSRIQAPLEDVFAWHERPGALERLSPPWNPIQVIERKGGIRKGAQVTLKMKAGIVPYIWKAEHIDYELNRLFRDRQVRGPFASWVHTHIFEPDGQDACVMEDHIDYSLPAAPLGDFFGNRMVQQQLEAIFRYRHTTLKQDLSLHCDAKSRGSKTILISGASGVVGRTLVPFLTTGGHRVIRLVRKHPQHADEVYWNPDQHLLDDHAISEVNAVVHLAGENIGEGRWTDEKKKKIIDSRVNGTRLIAETLLKLDNPPEVLICASAIGYYGNRGNAMLREEDEAGVDFISSVCKKWEEAAYPAVEKGIRVVFLRIGVALTPLGGALQRLMLPFLLGLGGKLGSGQQYVSWIGMDDVIGVIHHAMMNNAISGPVNVVSPNPVTNEDLTKTLGRVLARPTLMTVPGWAIKLAFGEMGREVPLSSTRVSADKLIKSGYVFRHPDLETAFAHLLGKAKE